MSNLNFVSRALPLVVVIGKKNDNEAQLSFVQENLNHVLSQVPPGYKVATISVVGVFGSGKSFLLSWFIKYLESVQSSTSPDEAHMNGEWYNSIHSVSPESGFFWMGGAERRTTGMWIWSKPFVLTSPSSTLGNDDKNKKDEKIAVILIDTQGMFDHETSSSLTASLFAMSSLISSYQIFNVDKRIQEDHLQQLALFSEYGKLATEMINDADKKLIKPFQLVEFLVRDWQNFECDGKCSKFSLLNEEMERYLQSIMTQEDKPSKELRATREQITSCYEQIKCYMLPHPGKQVTRKKFKGEINLIDETFKRLLSHYCIRIFKNLEPKKINGRELDPFELFTYMNEYAKLFCSSKILVKFPEPVTLFKATNIANNANAKRKSLALYKTGMDIITVNCKIPSKYMDQMLFKRNHESLKIRALSSFDDMTNFGNPIQNATCRMSLESEINEIFVQYSKINEAKNSPIMCLHMIIIPTIISLCLMTLDKILHLICSRWFYICNSKFNALSEISALLFIFAMAISLRKAKQIISYIKMLQYF